MMVVDSGDVEGAEGKPREELLDERDEWWGPVTQMCKSTDQGKSTEIARKMSKGPGDADRPWGCRRVEVDQR